MKQNRSKCISRFLFLLFGLVLALYLAVFFWINSGTDQVLFTEEPLSGSPSAADGLTIRYHSTFHEQHYWDSEFTLPAYQDAHTDYSYRPDGRPLPDDPKEPLIIDNQVSQGYVTVPSELEEPYQSLYRLAARQPDTEVMQTFSLAEYVDHYPLTFCFSFSNLSQESLVYDSGFTYPGYLDIPHADTLAPLAHAFPIPVPAEETFTWSMIADGDGNIRCFDFNPTANQRPADASPVPSAFYRMQCFSVRADDTIYFCINSKSQSGRVMDFSQLPLGYGLYALPLRPIDDNPKWLPVSEELSMIHPLDPNMDLISLSLSPDGQQLLLFAVENGSYTVTVLDLSGTVLQTLPVAPCADGLMGGELVDCGDYLVALLKDADRLAVLSRTADGSLQLDFTCPFHPDSWQDSDLTLSDAALAYDGTRLALAYPSPGSRQFFVDVYTADGLACSAKYSTSLYKTSPFGACHGTEDALSLSWN